MAGMISGSLVQRYWVDVPGDPGNANPAAHRTDDDHDDGAHAQSASAQRMGAVPTAPAGGSWVAAEVTEGQVTVLPGAAGHADRNHRSSGSHKGTLGDGHARLDLDLDQPLEHRAGGMHDPATLATAGTGGAAYERRQDMNPASNPGGILLGHRYVPVALRRRQGMHWNRPGLRAIRAMPRTSERDSPSPGGATSMFNPLARMRTGGGPSMPRLRRLLRPVGSSAGDMGTIDQAPVSAVVLDPGPIGSEWVQ